jgi:tetratricopeptide (TPR) repeat protein
MGSESATLRRVARWNVIEASPFRAALLLRARALVALLALALACLSPSIVRAEDEDPECARRFEEAIRLISEAEKTGSVSSAKRAWETLAVAERRCRYNPSYPYYSCLAHVFGRDADGATAALDRLVAILVERQRQLNRPEKDAQTEPMVLFLRATMDLYLFDQPGKAVERLTQVRARNKTFNPDEVRTLFFRAYIAQSNVLAHHDDYERAIAQALLALEEVRTDVTDKRRLDATRNLAQLYRIANRFKESQETWEGLLKKNPKDAVYHYGLASVLADQYQFPPAVAEWVETIRLIEAGSGDPIDLAMLTDAHLRYGVSLLHAGRVEEGRKELEDFAAKNPADPRPRFHLGRYYLDEAGDPVRALEQAERARAIDPWCEGVLKLLLQIYANAKPDPEKEKAIRALLEDEKETKARQEEMDRRRRSRRDQTEGCN